MADVFCTRPAHNSRGLGIRHKEHTSGGRTYYRETFADAAESDGSDTGNGIVATRNEMVSRGLVRRFHEIAAGEYAEEVVFT